MIIRPATIDDEPVVLEMAKRFRDTTSYRTWQGPDEALHWLFALVLQCGVCFLAEDDGGVIGMLALFAVPHPLTAELYADELAWWVNPAHRGSSAGLRLLEAAENWSRQRHLVCLRMVAPVDVPAVARVYQRRGYEATETTYIKRWT